MSTAPAAVLPAALAAVLPIALAAVLTAALTASTLPVADAFAGPGGAGSASTSAGLGAASGGTVSYVVLAERGIGDAAARAAVAAAGGVVRASDADVGYLVADSPRPDFARRVAGSPALVGAARNRTIGRAPRAAPQTALAQPETVPAQPETLPAQPETLPAQPKILPAQADTVLERSQVGRERARVELGRRTAEALGASSMPVATAADPPVGLPTTQVTAPRPEPLAGRQWDMQRIGATATGSYALERGSAQVLVGVIDTGVDGTHPDIAPNFDRADSRNFTTDIPAIDGPCEVPSCRDPVDVDGEGHGTHVASTIGSPINGLGIAGVAPGVTLVNLRAGQDSGLFFLQPTLDALTYAGRLGVDVVNMSFYVDPWLYNCADNPSDSPDEQQEQRTIRASVQRALDFARSRGVLPVAASGNQGVDLGAARKVDGLSPDYPPGQAKRREVSNSCISVPAESDGVLTVNATNYGDRLASYSNYGLEQSDVSAPGGDFGSGNPARLVLAAYPEAIGRAAGTIGPDGRPTSSFVVRDCDASRCAYYQYLDGTSMASPHAAGVAALVVSRFGKPDRVAGHRPGLTLAPAMTQGVVQRSARDVACPSTGTRCKGPASRNGFYGEGIVDAGEAVR